MLRFASSIYASNAPYVPGEYSVPSTLCNMRVVKRCTAVATLILILTLTLTLVLDYCFSEVTADIFVRWFFKYPPLSKQFRENTYEYS